MVLLAHILQAAMAVIGGPTPGTMKLRKGLLTALLHTRPLGLDYDGEHQQEHCEDGDTVCVRVTRRCLV